MYYRLEAEHDYISVRHVETDRELGYVWPGEWHHPKHGMLRGCRIFDMSGRELATVTTLSHPRPMECAAVAVANQQRYYNFRGLRATAWNNHADRLEHRLGDLLSDVISNFACGFRDAADCGLTAVTRDKFAECMGELASLWWVSRFGCFDATRRTDEPYFANLLPSGPRLSFSGAAQVYGMRKLRARHPNLSEAELRKVLGWALQWLSDLLLHAEQKVLRKRDQVKR